MTVEGNLEIVFADGPGAVSYDGGAIKRRIVLRVDGEDRDVVTVRLDSDRSRQRQAKRWAKAFGSSAEFIEDKLRRAAVVATEEAQQNRTVSKVTGTDSPPPPVTPHTLEEARPVFAKWLKDTDPWLLDVIFGTIMAHRLDGDPVWLFIVGAPGDGKTEGLRALSEHPSIYMLSTLTPGAMISGYVTDGPDPSLLPKLDGKILVVKDFTTILQMPNESRSEVVGILRDAYDGEACKVFGTGEEKHYRSRFGMLASVTPAIDTFWGVSQQLGERFLKFRLPSGSREEKVNQALSNTDHEGIMRDELAEAAMGVLAQIPSTPDVPSEIEQKLISLADFVALARSDVSRNRSGVVQYVPAPEVGTRVGKALKKLAMGIAMARGSNGVLEEEYQIAARVGLDTIPSMRGRLLGVLWRMREGNRKTAIIADEAEVPTDTAKVWLDDLRLLGMADRGGDQHTGYSWRLREGFRETIVRAGLFGRTCTEGEGCETVPLTSDPDPVVRGAQSPPSSPDYTMASGSTPAQDSVATRWATER